MNYWFVNNVQLSDRRVEIKELIVKEYKYILKSLIGDTLEPEIIFTVLNNVLVRVTNLTREEIESLNFVDYFILLFEIRCFSIGNIIFAETQEQVTTKIEINILKFIDQLKQLYSTELLTEETIEDFIIGYKLPTIKEIFRINADVLETIHCLFLSSIDYKGTKFNFVNSTIEEISIFDKLPVKLTQAFIKRSYTVIERFNDVNLISYLPGLKNKNLLFNFNIQNLCIIVKLLFGDQLMSLYDNIFALCKIGNFTPEYIENCTPGEYFLFVKKLEEINAKQSYDNSTEQNVSGMEDSIDDNINPYITNDLPPIVGGSEFPRIGG